MKSSWWVTAPSATGALREEILPRILTDTLGGCPVLNKEVHAL